MGNRHLILVYYKGGYQIAQYGQWDGQPEYQGTRVLAFLKGTRNIDKLKAAIDTGMIYTPAEFQMKQWYKEMENLPRVLHDDHRSASQRVCPSISRETGADILNLVANATEFIPIVKFVSFALDMFYCEWIYVVDLDKSTFEVFAHGPGNVEAEPNSRFDNMFCPGEDGMPDKVVSSEMSPRGLWTLDALPQSEDEFLDQFI